MRAYERSKTKATRSPVVRLRLAELACVALLSGSLVGCEGDGAASETAEGGESDIPAAPTGLAAVAREGGIELTWKDNSDNEFHFMLYRKQPGEEFSETPYVYPAADEVSFFDDETTSGIEYTYRILAMSESDTGPVSKWSNEASATAE